MFSVETNVCFVPLADLQWGTLRLARWENFGRSVNYNPGAGHLPEFVPAGNGTAHVFKTGCPSLRYRRTGEFVVLDEAGS